MKYTVNSLAKLLNVSSMTIRRYAEMGYITPEKNEKNNYTYYDSSDIDTIVRIRMYRKYGFTHEDIKKMLNSEVGEIIETFESKLEEMEREFEKLKALKHRVKDNLIMIKRIAEFEKGYITQDTEATYYVIYQQKDKILNEKERIEAVQKFIYGLPETKEIMVFDKTDVENQSYEYALGVSAKKKDTDKFKTEINEYMEFQPEQKCVYFLLKTYKDDKGFEKENNEIKKEQFEKAKEYLKKQGLKINRNILGFNITTAVEDNLEWIYTLICLPVEEI